MKICPSCTIQIDGDRTHCPFCQNALSGTPGKANWPPVTRLRHQALLYKIQLFIVLVLIVIALFLDYILKLNTGLHYSQFVVLWGFASQVLVKIFIKHHSFPARVVTICSVVASFLLCFTAYYIHDGIFTLMFYYIAPGIIGATVIANFVFALTDKHGNSLIYLLIMIVIGIIPYVVLKIIHENLDLFWSICMVISIIATLAIVIFRGKNVLSELQKRFNF